MKRRSYKVNATSSISKIYSLQRFKKIPGFSVCMPKDETYIVDIEMSEERYQFDMNGDAHSAINIFVKCLEKKYYPPVEILEYLSSKFKKYLVGSETIESATGLSKSAKATYKKAKRNIDLVIEIDTLLHYFKINLEDAIDMVSRRYDEMSGNNIRKLKATTIKEIYNREGKSELQKGLMLMHEDIVWADGMSEASKKEWKDQILSRYPDDVKERIQANEKVRNRRNTQS